MTVLVTGASGFTGSHLATALARQGHRVRALVRRLDSIERLVELGVEPVEGDLVRAADVERAMVGTERVYHIAACYRTANHPDRHYFEVNVGGTEHVLAAARKHGSERVVHCSTIGVHGSVAEAPAGEDAPFAPGDVYQRSKLEGELRARRAQEAGQPVAIFRPAGIYGPGDTRFLKLFKMVQRGSFRIFGAGTVNLHLIYIADLVDGILRCGTKPEALGEIFILCGPDYLPLVELVREVADAVGVEPPRRKLPLWPLMTAAAVCEAICVPLGIDPPLHRRRADFFTKNRAFTCDKAGRMLGFAPRVSSREGLRRTAAWYFEQGLLDGDRRL